MENLNKLSTKKILNGVFTKGQIETANMFGCNPENVALSQTDLPYCEYFFGDLILRNVNGKCCIDKKIKAINGNFIMVDCNCDELCNIEEVTGSVSIVNSKIGVIKNLKCVGSTLYLKNSQVDNVCNLTKVTSVDMNNSKIINVCNLEKIRYNLYLKNSYIKNALNLIYVGREFLLEKSKIDFYPKTQFFCNDMLEIKKDGTINHFPNSKILESLQK